ALRESLGLPGSKNACEQGECGSCSLLLDGDLVCSCLVLAAQAEGHDIVTVEGLAQEAQLHPVQEAFAETGAVQCGFCTPGLIVATADLLAHNPDPSDDEIREALVAAEHPEQARRAAERIEVEYEPLEPVVDPERATEQETLHEENPTAGHGFREDPRPNVLRSILIRHGDPDTEGDVSVSGVY